MPRAARNRAASPVPAERLEEHPDEVMQGAAGALQFDEPLTWRAGKPIPVSDLLRRLKTLYEELRGMDQEGADRGSLVPKAQELANVQLLSHKDKGVKACSMLCIVEMFRLLAPDAPYKGGQLKQIFDLFVSTIVPALASPTDPYNQQHQLILASLTTIKSIVLLTDIPGSETLTYYLFTNCFDVMSGNVKGGHGEQVSKNVEYHMTNMLVILVDEITVLPTSVVDTILAQFLRADPNALAAGSKKGSSQHPFTVREVSPAYNMARSVCNSCGEKMNRAVFNYFGSVLIDATESFSTTKPAKSKGRKRTHDESEDESDDGLLTPPAEDDYGEAEKAHRLLRELWRSSPDVIRNVVPQIEAELAAENAQLRTMAVHTVGDMIAGIGAAGPPPPLELDPSAYPSQSLESTSPTSHYDNVLLAPAAPHAFSSVYPNAYQGFIDRHRDKAGAVRSVWATAAGRILVTSGGGKGLDKDQENLLLRYLSDMLMDQDERVRLAAVQAVASFDFGTIVQRIGSNGSINADGTILSNLTDRIKDRKPAVRVAAMELLARIWGVAAGAIAEGSGRIRDLLGPIPTKLLLAAYINDREINATLQRVLFDSLLPIAYPPIKKATTNGDSQRVADSQVVSDEPDPDALRAERILVLVRDLDERAKKVFFSLQQQQVTKAKYIERYLQACAAANGDAEDDDEMDGKSTKKELDMMISALSKLVPDSPTAVEHLKKFAKHHDRRSYQLIRFCFSPESDYRKIIKATKELTKRMEEAPSGTSAVLETLLPLVRSASNLVFNRSHVPAIMDFARTDDKELGSAAHEVMKEISTTAPDVFKVHVHEMCEGLRRQAPTAASPNQPTAVDELKACAGFAQRFPEEMPKNRDFYRAMAAFAKHGTPPEAAKHAVTVIVASADKREMYIKDIVKYCLEDFEYGAECFLSRLAALSQLKLVASKDVEEYEEQIFDLTASKILGEVRTVADDTDVAWNDEIDDDLCSKLWALKILVNGLRGMKTSSDQQEARAEIGAAAARVYKLLNTLIERDGELSNREGTAEHHKAHLRLAAATQLLKLSCSRLIDSQLTPADFNRLAKVAQDPLPEVRGAFVKTLRKYLGQSKLPNRFYCIAFLYAFEPLKSILESTSTWLKARAALSAKSNDTAMESVFARFLSLLAHHQDFGRSAEELEDFVEYIMFYLKNVATQANLPLIYHIAQRIKSVQDGVDPEGKSENLYILSDLAEAVIRCFRDAQGWNLQIYSGKVRLPTGIFAQLPSHTLAQEIAEKRFVPAELEERVEDLVKASLRPKKRKHEGASKQAAKKAKVGAAADGGGEKVKKEKKERKLAGGKASKSAKTPSKKKEKKTADDTAAAPSSDRRKSARGSRVKNYAEDSESKTPDDDDVAEWEWQDDDSNKENQEEGSSTPPTSDPTPASVAEKQVVVEEERSGKGRRGAGSRAVGKKTQPVQRATRARPERDEMDVPEDSEEEVAEPVV